MNQPALSPQSIYQNHLILTVLSTGYPYSPTKPQTYRARDLNTYQLVRLKRYPRPESWEHYAYFHALQQKLESLILSPPPFTAPYIRAEYDDAQQFYTTRVWVEGRHDLPYNVTLRRLLRGDYRRLDIPSSPLNTGLDFVLHTLYCVARALEHTHRLHRALDLEDPILHGFYNRRLTLHTSAQIPLFVGFDTVWPLPKGSYDSSHLPAPIGGNAPERRNTLSAQRSTPSSDLYSLGYLGIAYAYAYGYIKMRTRHSDTPQDLVGLDRKPRTHQLLEALRSLTSKEIKQRPSLRSMFETLRDLTESPTPQDLAPLHNPNTALSWLRNELYKDDRSTLYTALTLCDPLTTHPTCLDYLWSHLSPTILDRFKQGQDLPTDALYRVLRNAPNAREHLFSLLRAQDTPNHVKSRITQTLVHLPSPLTHAQQNTLTDLLNAPWPTLRQNAASVLQSQPDPIPVSLTSRTPEGPLRIAPCSLRWEDLVPSTRDTNQPECERRFCNQCERNVVRVTDLEQLRTAHSARSCVFFDPSPEPDDPYELGTKSDVYTIRVALPDQDPQTFFLAKHEAIRIGSGDDNDISFVPGLDDYELPTHAVTLFHDPASGLLLVTPSEEFVTLAERQNASRLGGDWVSGLAKNARVCDGSGPFDWMVRPISIVSDGHSKVVRIQHYSANDRAVANSHSMLGDSAAFMDLGMPMEMGRFVSDNIGPRLFPPHNMPDIPQD